MTIPTLLKHLMIWVSVFAWPLAQAGEAPGLRPGDIEVGAGVRIHYLETGNRGAATTLLFVPGWGTSSAIWRDQLAFFAEDFRVVAIDPRSQGDSTITPSSNTPEQRAQDLRRVIEALRIRKVVLIGWSQGVQDVAAYAAAFKGGGVAGYVLVDAPVAAGAAASVAAPGALKEQLEMLAFYERRPEDYLRGMLQAIIRSDQGRARLEEFVKIGLRTPPDLGIAMLMMDFIAVDRHPALAQFNRPTLVLAAADSDELQAIQEMAKRIQGARLEIIDQAGHALFLDQPERFRDRLRSFLTGLGKKGGEEPGT